MLRLIPCAVLALGASVSANVLVVAPSGAPFTTVQAAVDAAIDGDVILVKAGFYAGFTVNGKALALVSDPEGAALIQGDTMITGVGVGKTTSLSGFMIRTDDLRAQANAGSLRFEALTSLDPIEFMINRPTALFLYNCLDVAVLRCSLRGSSYWSSIPSSPGHGVLAVDSNVAIYDSVLGSGVGSPAIHIGSGEWIEATAGEAACWMRAQFAACTVLLAGCTSIGGTGGTGLAATCSPSVTNGGAGAAGGPGVLAINGAQSFVRDSLVQGGPGGIGGAANSNCSTSAGPQGPTGAAIGGNSTALSGARRVMTCVTHMRESNTLVLSLQGEPGDAVILNLGTNGRWLLDAPLGGVRLVSLTSRRVNLGTIPGSGLLDVALPIGDLGLGVQSATYQLQAYFVDFAGGVHAGSAATLVVLDSAF